MSKDECVMADIKRRDFLKIAAATAAVAGGMRIAKTVAASDPGSSPHKWAMVIDQAKCTGCNYCTTACQAANDVPPEISWTRVLEAGEVKGEKIYLPRPCQHCENAPCVDVCMVKATYRRPDGIVMMNYDRCLGCRYCQIACPYSVRAFNWESFTGDNPAVPTWGKPEIPRRPRGVVEKCSFCYHRIDRGLDLGLTPGVDALATPACVVVCPVGARSFGDLNDPDSPVSQKLASSPSYRLREDLGTSARVFYLPAREERKL
jgi:dimethyl sulfoxide reductase iron-sulfur subunit